MSNVSRLVILLCIAGVVVLLSRELPFLLFRRKEIPSLILYLGKVLPAAIMATLVIYCLRGMSFEAVKSFVPQLIAMAVTVGLHLWKHKSLLSIVGGTLCYMLLVQYAF